uniref:Uncharacterized protein n=1 Tax=Anopheles culicifacies TaxID=139723 RepID=A0A182MUY0_9DIPT
MSTTPNRTMEATSHQRRTMKKMMVTGVLVANLLLSVMCFSGAGIMVSASAIPTASFPSNSNGVANSASTDVGHRRTTCVAVHPILKQRGVDPIDMPIDPIPDTDVGGVQILNAIVETSGLRFDTGLTIVFDVYLITDSRQLKGGKYCAIYMNTQFHEHAEYIET